MPGPRGTITITEMLNAPSALRGTLRQSHLKCKEASLSRISHRSLNRRPILRRTGQFQSWISSSASVAHLLYPRILHCAYITMHSKYLGQRRRHTAEKVHSTARPYSDLTYLFFSFTAGSFENLKVVWLHEGSLFGPSFSSLQTTI